MYLFYIILNFINLVYYNFEQMDNLKFSNYQSNKAIIKLGSEESVYMFNREYNALISFRYSFTGKIIANSNDKIYYFFKAYNLYKCPSNLQKIEIEDEILILVNKNQPDYAILYKISVDKNGAKLLLIEEPEIGKEYLTDNEINGIISFF